MRKKIATTVLALLMAALPVLAATTDFVANANITVANVSSVGDMIIKNGSKAASWVFNSGTFTVTDPDATAGFTILSSDTDVTAFQILNDTTGVGLSCDLNNAPGTTEKELPTDAGTYRIVASTVTACTQLCTTLTGAATYNAYPTCGAATCNAGFRLSGSNADAVCLVTGGGGVSGGGGGGYSSLGLAATPTPTPTPSVSATPTPSPSSSSSSSSKLIRYAGDPKVYVIENNQKRWVKTGEDFTKLGYKWSDVKIAPATETYTTGSDKTYVAVTPSASSAVTLIRYAGDPKVYVIENNQKRWVKTGEDFTKLGYKWSDVKIAPASETYSDGAVKTATTATTVATTFTQTLKRGSKGAEVLALQQKLKDLGYFPANVEMVNNFGPTTQKAVKDFQKANGLAQSGTVDAATRALLNK